MTDSSTTILNINSDIKRACEVLRNGGIILYPTDTIWGIGCDATNDDAVAKIYQLKQRCDSKALIILLGSDNQLHQYIDDVPDIAYELIDAAIKPLTIVFDKGRNISKSLCAEDGSVGIRVTNEQFSKQLCRVYRRPIVSTSANISGTPTPLRFNEICDEIKNGVDYIVEYRRNDTSKNQPSSVIKLGNDGTIKILRH